MQLALQQLHAMFLFALFAARSLFTLRSALSLCNLDFLGPLWFGIFVNWLPGNCNWHSFSSSPSPPSPSHFASRSAQRWRCTFARLDETLKRSWTRCSLPGHGHGMAWRGWHLSHWAFRWNVEMKWYALIKNELTQHAANAAADAADVSRCSSRGWGIHFISFHCSVSLFFSLVFSLVPCAPL